MQDQPITYLSIRSQDGSDEVIKATPNHPFYLVNSVDGGERPQPEGYNLGANWVGAGDLKIGDTVRRADGSTGTVVQTATVGETRQVYNLTVNTAHTYFVGEREWLVHNTVCNIDTIRYHIAPGMVPMAGSRATGINRAWALERQLIERTGRGSQNWTPAELDMIRKHGKVPGYTGHHINSVNGAPEWAGDPRNIVFLPNGSGGGPNLHRYGPEGHGPTGNLRTPTSGMLIDRQAMINRSGR